MKTNEFENETLSTINRIRTLGVHFQEAEWFLEIMARRLDSRLLHDYKPEIIALGEDIPAELLYAFTDHPFYVLGGSLGAAHWAEERTPRDTDPVSLSSLGMLLNENFDLAENALIVTAASSDSRRKLAAMLTGEGKQVAVLDVPPYRQDHAAVVKYTAQLKRLAEAMERHTGRTLTVRKLRDAVYLLADARRELRTFQRTALGMEQILPAPLRMLIAQSLYSADNLPEWRWQMARLNSALKNYKDYNYVADDNRPRVMVLGSPVLFPNYKLPLLIEDAKMHVGFSVDTPTMLAAQPPISLNRFDTLHGVLTQIAENQLGLDMSGAYTCNDVLFQQTTEMLSYTMIEGVVYHVLKGQIEYDFELHRLEAVAESFHVPVFRLETDYQYQDVEQLRIRMEAFGEVLMQRRIGKERIVR